MGGFIKIIFDSSVGISISPDSAAGASGAGRAAGTGAAGGVIFSALAGVGAGKVIGARAGGATETSGASATFGNLDLREIFFAGLAAGSLGAAVLTARGFFAGAAAPSGLAVFFVDEGAMPGGGRGFRS